MCLLVPLSIQMPSDGQAGQQSVTSRVAAVGPYIQSSTMPRGSGRHDLLVKPPYPDSTGTLPAYDPQSITSTGEETETIHHPFIYCIISYVVYNVLPTTQISGMASLK